MKIEVLDTTLRDGEQTPGISLNAIKKLRIATKLDEIGVNSIEAGSAITSEGEREAIKLITQELANLKGICDLADKYEAMTKEERKGKCAVGKLYEDTFIYHDVLAKAKQISFTGKDSYFYQILSYYIHIR